MGPSNLTGGNCEGPRRALLSNIAFAGADFLVAMDRR
jgi:hypothetical protein